MTKKEALQIPPRLYMFECILRTGQALFQDSPDWRQATRSMRSEWLKPLLEDGHIEWVRSEPAWPDGPPEGERNFKYHYFKTTPAGMKWWLSEMTSEIKDRQSEYIRLRDSGQCNLEGVGIGAECQFDLYYGNRIVMAGIQDGYFEFVSFYYYERGFNRNITVRLTECGLKFFDSLPRLQLECA